MVSVAVRRRPTDPYPLRVELWTSDMRWKASAAAKAALEGVGVPETDVREAGGMILTVRRMARDDERSCVTEKYLQI